MSFEIGIDRGPNGRSFEVRTEADLAKNEDYNTPSTSESESSESESSVSEAVSSDDDFDDQSGLILSDLTTSGVSDSNSDISSDTDSDHDNASYKGDVGKVTGDVVMGQEVGVHGEGGDRQIMAQSVGAGANKDDVVRMVGTRRVMIRIIWPRSLEE